MRAQWLRTTLAAAACLAALSASYVYGVYSHQHRLFPYPQLLSLRNHLFPLSIGFKDTTGRSVVPCRADDARRTMVVLALGQSNTGNHGETLYRPRRDAVNLFRGACYRAEDPLLGPTGDRGSIWTRMADMAIAEGLCDRAVIIPIGVGSTTVAQWAPGGYLHPRLVRAAADARAAGLAITHVFWILGGSEPMTDGDEANREQYKRSFRALVKSMRDLGVTAPVYVAVGTRNPGAFNRDIQRAQREVVDEASGIMAGPDTDALHDVPENRWEEVHFTHIGLERCARAWLDAIRKPHGRTP